MRVGLVIYGDLDTLSGGYLYDRKLVELLRRRGDQVTILSIPWRNYAAHLCDNLSVSLRRRIERLDVDILLQDELNHPSLVGINHWRRAAEDRPVVAIVHHLRCSEPRPAWMNQFYRWVERAYLRSADGFVFNSQTTRSTVEALIGRVSRGVVAYPAGDRLAQPITPAQIETRAFQPGPLRLLFLGNVIPRKGLHILLKALQTIPEKDWRLTVAGSLDFDKDYAGALRLEVKRSALSDRVHFSGPLDEKALIAHLRSHHVMVVPSFYEGFGIAYLEGMAYGLPAIASTAGAARELITHGQNGFLVPPADDERLAAHLAQLSGDRKRLAAMSQAARQRFLGHPTWEQTGEQIRSFIHNVYAS